MVCGKNALPSSEDLKHANDIIVTLRSAVRDAFNLIKSTKQRIVETKNDLVEPKGLDSPDQESPNRGPSRYYFTYLRNGRFGSRQAHSRQSIMAKLHPCHTQSVVFG